MSTELEDISFTQVIFTARMRMYTPEEREIDDKVSKHENWIRGDVGEIESVIELELKDGNPHFFARLTELNPNYVVVGETFTCKIRLFGTTLKKEYVKEGRTIYIWGGGRIAAGIIDKIEKIIEK